MLTYLEVHLYFLVPPILVLLALYFPLVGRRDALKIGWLCLMASIWTTPWDNFLLSYGGWSYPPHSILGRLWLVPYEEQAFFVLQPIFIVLLHSLATHSRLLPFDPPAVPNPLKAPNAAEAKVQTLRRRPLVGLFWALVCATGAVFVNEAHGLVDIDVGLGLGMRAFYLGWIFLWASPIIGGLSYLGGRVRTTGDWVTFGISGMWLCFLDSYAIYSGAWSISPNVTLGLFVWPHLPLEECVFFLLSTYLVILASSLISHLHTLLVLSPDLPPCPPLYPIAHVALLGRVALDPPEIDVGILQAFVEAEVTLRKGSKSFSVAKLAFGREMRMGLVAVYAWCRVTDNLIDELPLTTGKRDLILLARRRTLKAIRSHVAVAWAGAPNSGLHALLDEIPHLTLSDRSSFHLFASLVPRLCPVEPFMELCDGYEKDMAFSAPPTPGEATARNGQHAPKVDIIAHLPIQTSADLLQYADDVAGSIAAAICYLSWSLLTHNPMAPVRPVEAYRRAEAPRKSKAAAITPEEKSFTTPIIAAQRSWVVSKAREMGRALQLVNIARDVAKDALLGRVYIPLSHFSSAKALLAVLDGTVPTYSLYTIPTLDLADQMRADSAPAIAQLPRTARGGTRAMVASYFEIGRAVRRDEGEVDQRGIRVNKWGRAWAAARAFWAR